MALTDKRKDVESGLACTDYLMQQFRDSKNTYKQEQVHFDYNNQK